MTVTEWLACTNLQAKLEFLEEKASDRKLRLFACACCRRIWHLLAEGRGRRAVEIAERYADAGKEGLSSAILGDVRLAIMGVENEAENLIASAANAAEEAQASAAFAALRCVTFTGQKAADYSSLNAVSAAYHAATAANAPSAAKVRDAERAEQTCILRDIAGNPFRPITISPAVMSWNDTIAVRLAQAAYDERILPAGTLDNARLAVLADALEEAGCSDEQILTHLRGGGEHYRGCWVIDLLLGKE
ncbi:MAG TPA: hypothetical protein VH682_21855 [Gemmataceae bacterium]|jgi:hypothetical protein